MGIPFITPFWVAKNGSLNTTRSDPFLVHFGPVAPNRICDCFFQKTVSWGDEGTFKKMVRDKGGGVCIFYRQNLEYEDNTPTVSEASYESLEAILKQFGSFRGEENYHLVRHIPCEVILPRFLKQVMNH
mgnify:CR=1 FL=1